MIILGIYLRDFTFVDEGSSNVLPNGFVNFSKMQKLNAIVQDMEYYQSSPYVFPVEPRLQNYLQNISSLSEVTLYSLSVRCEPPSEI